MKYLYEQILSIHPESAELISPTIAYAKFDQLICFRINHVIDSSLNYSKYHGDKVTFKVPASIPDTDVSFKFIDIGFYDITTKSSSDVSFFYY